MPLLYDFYLRNLLEILRLSSVPCVNSAETLLRGYDRLAMLSEMRRAGLPVIDFDVVIGEQMLKRLSPELPAVVKAGNYHGGFGKTLVRTHEQWLEVCDLLFVTDEYITIEPYIDYVSDIRVLAVGDRLWAMKRRGRYWRANQITEAHGVIDVPEPLAAYTRDAAVHLSADIVGLDFLETKAGEYLLLECNDVPGLSGFPDEVRHAVSACLRDKMRQG